MARDALFAQALSSSQPDAALQTLARSWKAQDMSQQNMYALFDQQLKSQLLQADERLHDAVADTMDLLVAWCAPEVAIFRTSLPTDDGA